MGCLSTSPLPLKSNTRSYVSGCLLSQQTGPEVSPALRARPGRRESPRVQFPCTSQEGTGEVGTRRSESEGLEESSEEGGQNKCK